MGFPTKVKLEALRLSARHCSVCHRYKGIKMEVHHLVQEADGGPNDLENAIPLCFDCHSDAGHYNPRHPKGIKFSKQELKKSRDKWYKFVRENSVPEKLLISEHLQVSYYVLHNLDILDKTLSNDFSSVNNYRAKTYLATNEVSQFWAKLLQAHNKDYHQNREQNLLIQLGQFASIKEYKNKYSKISLVDKESDDYPYFEAMREVDWNELLNLNISNSFLNLIYETGIDAEMFCKSLLYKNDYTCGGETPIYGYTEYLEVVPLSFIFLSITNASRSLIKLNNLNTDLLNYKLPNFNLQPQEMVLVPLSTIANLLSINNQQLHSHYGGADRGEQISRVLNPSSINIENIFHLNTNIVPISVNYNNNEAECEVKIHELDYNNMYSINSYWTSGSCPHLFFKKQNGNQQYSRELLASSCNKSGKDSFEIPPLISQVIIRELEEEISYLDEVFINGVLTFSDIVLHKGDFIEFNVNENDEICIIGKYIPVNIKQSTLKDFWYRNLLISNSNRNYNHLNLKNQ